MFRHRISLCVVVAFLATVASLGSSQCNYTQQFQVPTQYGTINQAIAAAGLTPTDIVVAPGTYTESLVIFGPTYIRSSGNATNTTIRGTIIFNPGVTNCCKLEGFTITPATGAQAPGITVPGAASPVISNNVITGFVSNGGSGGGILATGLNSTPFIVGNFIYGNMATNGGAVAITGGAAATLHGNVILNNQTLAATGLGAGVYIDGQSASTSTPTVDFNIIQWNPPASASVRPQSGGGIYCTSTEGATIADNDISYNKAGDGGGVFLTSNTNAVVTDNTILFNEALTFGGGVYVTNDSTARLELNDISANFASSSSNQNQGGGVAFIGSIGAAGSSVLFNRNRVASNAAPQGGGIACRTTGAAVCGPWLTNNWICRNSASVLNGGGCIADGDNAVPTLLHNSFEGNTATTDGGALAIVTTTAASLQGNILVDGCILWNDTSGTGNTDEIYVANTTVAQPRIWYCCIRGALGGPGWTATSSINQDPLYIAPGACDLRIALSSPCANSGDPNIPSLVGALDYPGGQRILHTIDIGGHEAK